MEVEYVTLGDAANRLEVPAPTLRNWTDQLEEFNVHYVLRNNRNERIYTDDDLKIFRFVRDLKKEFGRKTTTKDIAYILKERAEKNQEFNLRTKDEVGEPLETSIDTLEILNQEDIQQLLSSNRVKQFTQIIIQNLKEDLKNEIKEEMVKQYKEIDKKLERIEKMLNERDQKLMATLRKMQENQESKKGFFQRLFGK